VIITQLSLAGQVVAQNVPLRVKRLTATPKPGVSSQQEQQQKSTVVYALDNAVFYAALGRKLFPGRVVWALHENGALHVDVTPWCAKDMALRQRVLVSGGLHWAQGLQG
jgi:hypothetical protein